jgi:hypothetical protein
MGLGYYQYFGGNKKIFACPDAALLDDYRDLGYSYPRVLGKFKLRTMPIVDHSLYRPEHAV